MTFLHIIDFKQKFNIHLLHLKNLMIYFGVFAFITEEKIITFTSDSGNFAEELPMQIDVCCII